MNYLRKKVFAVIFTLCVVAMSSVFFTNDMNEIVAGESGISKSVLSVKYQISENTTTQTSKLRIVSTIDNLEDYKMAGFDITYGDKEIPYETTKAYQSIEAVSDGVDYTYSPNVFDIESKYFITVTLINLPLNDTTDILIKPYVVPVGGNEKVYGTHRYVSIADAKDNTVLSIPIEMTTSISATYTVTSGETTYDLKTEDSYYDDGTYTHFRIDMEDRTALKSVTTFTVSDGTNEYTAKYRNLNNTYSGTADTTWYDVNSDYNVIATSADLYGFAQLSADSNFELETIYLGADIVVNEGTSTEWLANAVDDDSTNNPYAWTPIASSKAFAGIFDGQGHTISGLYVNTSSNSQGLFSQTADNSKITHLRLENSYFKSSHQTSCVGGISSKGGGTFDTIYVNVEIVCSGTLGGGVIARVNENATAIIQNCWFAGSITIEGERAGGIVGTVGNDSKTGASATISHCFNSGNVTTSYNNKQVRVGGICGAIISDSKVTMNDCLNVGTIKSSAYTGDDVQLGAILGMLGTGAQDTYSYEKLYSTTDSCDPVENKGKSYTQQYARSEIKGFSGYNLSKLTFEPTDDSAAYWVVRANDTPALASLVDSAIRTIPSTAWHDETNGVEKDGIKVYTISTVADLYGFSKLSAEGETFAGEKIQLGTDIKVNKGLAASWEKYAPDNEWLPIGKTTPFAGTFDGQGHTISGIYVKDTNYVGLFAQSADNSMIQDVRLKNSYICDTDASDQVSYNGSVVGHGLGDLNTVYSDAIIHGERHGTGGLVGVIDGTGTSEIVNCQFDGSIEVFTTTQETRTGGIVGSLQADSATVTVSHCLNTGTIHSAANTAATRMGGVCGTVGGSCTLTVRDCLVVGSLTADGSGTITKGALTGQKGNNGTIHIMLSYASKDSHDTLAPSKTSVDSYSTAKETTDFVGELAYTNTYLEFDSPENSALFDGHWTLVKDGNYPQLRSFATGEMVTPSSIKGDTRWYTTAEESATEYTIYTADELYGFAKLVNSSGYTFDGKTVSLGADLIMNTGKSTDWNAGTEAPAYSWSRIGSSQSKYFAGTFDGKGFTISGLYVNGSASNVGLFGITSTKATIKDIVVSNSYFKGAKAIGAVAAQGGGTFDTIYVKKDVYVTSTDRWCGGIIGILCPYVEGESVTEGNPNRISNCWFAGTLKAGRYGGGIAGSVGKHGVDTATNVVDQGRVTTIAEIENCLNTGSITHTGITTTDTVNLTRTGGICGAIVTTSSSDYSEVTIEDCLNTGTVISEIASASNYGDIYGHVYNYTHITLTDVYATDESCSEPGGNSTGNTTTTGSITRGFYANDITGFSGYITLSGLSYSNEYLPGAANGVWVAVEGSHPVLTSFSEGYTLVDFAPFVLEGNEVATMIDSGAGNAVITVSNNDSFYDTYIEKIAEKNGLGFELCYSNGETGLDNGAVLTSAYKKGKLIITVTYVKNTKTTYISAGSTVELSPYLDEKTVTGADGDATSGVTSLSMLGSTEVRGGAYIIQLENGHFIVHDSGETETDYSNFVSYLTSLVTSGEKPVIDAWIISHGDVDHYGILKYINDSDGDGVCDDFYVDGIYFTEPSLAICEATNKESTSFAKIIRNSAKQFRTSSNEVAKLYRMYTGQTYYFDGAKMEVLLTHEQLTGYTDFNETSVWCKYTIGSGNAAKTFMNGADSSTKGMEFIMSTYSSNYVYSDLFAALHHGVNTTSEFTEYLKANNVQNGHTAGSAILYSRQSDPTDASGYYQSEVEKAEGWDEEWVISLKQKKIKELNEAMHNAVYSSVGENKFFYYGAGTVKLNFTDNGITGGCITTVE